MSNLKMTMLLIAVVLTSALSAQENPTLYLIGDSTMSDKKNPEQNPELKKAME